MMNKQTSSEDASKRIANVISLLIPAKSYRIHCSWTRDKALPAIEDFACRLLLLFGELMPSELQNFFGLSSREREVLIDTLTKNRLVCINEKGVLVPTPTLAKQSLDGEGPATLTEYDERSEIAVFDLLTKGLMPRKPFDSSRFGLPELGMSSSKVLGSDEVIAQFSSQYRAHLEYTRTNSNEIKNTRLYKVASCEPYKTLQIPVDMDIHVQASSEAEPRVFRDAVETTGGIRRRALSNDLEACIADYFSGLQVPRGNLSFEEYCEEVDDDVLRGFIDKGNFNFSSWLVARENRGTGYGNQETTAMLGPVYLKSNRTRIIKILRECRREWDANEQRQAIWLSSDVPLWGASGGELADFNRKVEKELAENTLEKGSLSTVFQVIDNSDKWDLKNKFCSRISNIIAHNNGKFLNRMELFVIPGVLAVTQYHIQPNLNSGVTVPVGYVTTDAKRIERLATILAAKLKSPSVMDVLWSKDDKDISTLLGKEFMGIMDENAVNGGSFKSESKGSSKDAKITIKRSRRKLSLSNIPKSRMK